MADIYALNPKTDAENKALAVAERAATQRNPLSELDYTYDEVGNRVWVDASGAVRAKPSTSGLEGVLPKST